ncbi:MAG: FAD:protein FMN transferase [Oscillospiraceae bacterium]|nr:FAD:protein FMN transferase [Oscillospiraceae bacterium]
MDTVMNVTVYGDNSEKLVQQAGNMLDNMSVLWSVTDENSEIYAINHSGGGTVDISAETSELIRFALEMDGLTDGALDVTLYPVIKEWGFTTGEYKIPSEERLYQLLKYTGTQNVILAENSVTVAEGTEIDLGAVAKGYAGDKLYKYLTENGVTSALLDLGGNIHAIGVSPDGSPWRLGVRSPDGNGNVAVLEISDMAAVTSGGYERYFIGDDGKRYCHIIDPATGCPADSGLASATIVGRHGALCDALSTAVYVMGAEKAEALWRKIGGFDMILITDGGDMLITEGLKDVLSIADAFYGELKVIS